MKLTMRQKNGAYNSQETMIASVRSIEQFIFKWSLIELCVLTFRPIFIFSNKFKFIKSLYL